ncbi:DUF975 family protein [Weissella viridescens]|uniref:DUF975 family protein n=1 Tax=Weissella viridescens TaxID=1629 RepID=UPI0025775557|nr:DUF975 family protein [Weissella viridescens]WJI90647.1 DUF975 family protein [Weissella viridescens]
MPNERVMIKQEARDYLNKNYGYNFKLFLITILTYVLLSVATDEPSGWVAFALVLITIVNFFVTISTSYVSLDGLRAEAPTGNPITQQTESLKSKYVWGVIVISLLMSIYTTLWTLLLIVPGIVKSYSYSQALNIYKDSVDAGQPLGYNEAITKSRELMDGHKADLFIMHLSFISWGLLVIVTFGIALFYVYPYFTLAGQNFYKHLVPGRLGLYDLPETVRDAVLQENNEDELS